MVLFGTTGMQKKGRGMYDFNVIGMQRIRPCNCGSGKDSWWEYDYQGIELDRVCDSCVKEKLSKYRPEILSKYDQSDVDEPIEDEL